MNQFYSEIYEIIKQIPEGKVMSYGQIASHLGRPRNTREVGRVLRHSPNNIPWHRVVMADGTVSGGEHSQIRRAMLVSEGVSFLEDNRVDMKKHRHSI